MYFKLTKYLYVAQNYTGSKMDKSNHRKNASAVVVWLNYKVAYFLKIFSMAFPLANSSTNLSR